MPGNEQCIFAGLMADDIKGMNACINKIALEMFSFFDTGKGKQSKPERFYHGHFNGIDGKISKEKNFYHRKNFSIFFSFRSKISKKR